MQVERNQRILLIDDNPAIHDDFKKILAGQAPASAEVDDLLSDFLGGSKPGQPSPTQGGDLPYEISSALQGQEALKLVQQARQQGRPFALAFVDVRMPPGWDGIVTLQHLFEADPELQAVICTAYSDYSYADMLRHLGHSDRLLILKKPFDPIEVQQLAGALLEKWYVTRCNQNHLEEVRAYAASLETVNRALSSDKAMAEAFSQGKTDFIVRAGKLFGRGVADLRQDLEQACAMAGEGSLERSELRRLLPRAGDLERLLEEVLLLAELDANRLVARAAECDLADLLSDCRADWSRSAVRLGKPCSVRPSGPLPRSSSLDGPHLRRLLDHLLQGALAIAPRGVEMQVGLENRNQLLGSMLRFELRLPGLSLDPVAAQCFFEPFAEGHPHLHLALAKGEARLLRAELFVESEGLSDTRLVLRLDPGLAQGAELFELPSLAA